MDSSLKFTAWVETRFGFTADVFEEVEPTEILRCMRAAMRKTCRLNVMEEESITRESQGVMEEVVDVDVGWMSLKQRNTWIIKYSQTNKLNIQ